MLSVQCDGQGVPLVVLPGSRIVSRMSFSVQRAALGGVEYSAHFEASTASDYEDRAVHLARDELKRRASAGSADTGSSVLHDTRKRLWRARWEPSNALFDVSHWVQCWETAIISALDQHRAERPVYSSFTPACDHSRQAHGHGKEDL